MERYRGRVALVTGASAGIGAAITQALLRRGVDVVGIARRVERVQALELKDAPGKLYPLQGDVSREDSILAAFKWVRDNLSGVDILVNNAGILIDEELTCNIWGHSPVAGGELAMNASTKHAVRVLLEGLRKDLVARKSNIRVGEISPGLVKTDILSNTNKWTPELFDKVNCMEPEDVAEAAIYMLSQHPRVQVHDIIILPTGNPM